MEKKASELALKTTSALDAIVVTNDEDAERATVVIKEAKDMRTRVEAEKDEYVRPSKEIIEKAKTVYDPIISALKTAEQKLRDRVQAYLVEKEKNRQKKEDAVVAKVEAGTMKDTTAVRKLENIGEAKKSVAVGGVTLGLRKIKDIEIVDQALIPHEYYVLDMVKVKKVALAGVVIPGVKVVERTTTNLR